MELAEAMMWLPDSYYLCLFRSTGSYADQCEGRVAELGLSGRVTLLPRMDLKQLLRHMVCADVGVALYNDYRSSGYFMCNADKIGLYAACGLPVVASDYPNLTSLIYRHGLGLCCDAKRPKELASSVLALANDPDVLAEAKKCARDAFEGVLNVEIQARPLVIKLHNLLYAAG